MNHAHSNKQASAEHQHQRSAAPAGFTLIELLIVISIIAVLAGLLFPAISGAMKQAEKSQARTELASIKGAVLAFYSTYGKYPVPNSDQGNSDADKKEAASKAVIEILSAEETTVNPRKIVFLEVDSTDGEYLDPWGWQYGLRIDTDYDGKVTWQGKKSSGVIVFSRGPNETWDGNPDTTDDLSTEH